jgi:anti-sigma factor RsiW
MRCGRAEAMMAAALDGELPGRQRDALDRHLTTCPACAAEMARSERLHAALTAVPAEAPVPPGLADATLRRIRVLAAEAAERRGRRWTWIALPALGFAVATALAVVLRDAEPPPVERVAAAPAAPAPATPAPPTRVASVPRRPAPAAAPAAAEESPAVTAMPKEPPPELAARPDLFIDLRLLSNLEKIEHFEAISGTQVAPAARDGGRQG